MWTELHATRARKLIPNSRYRRVAGKMAASTFHALDHIEQAPVILVGACRGMQVKTGAEIARIAGRFATMVRDGTRLRDMLAAYGIAPQFRALAGHAIMPSAEEPVIRLSRLPDLHPSALAQAIPREPVRQAAWLRALAGWILHIDGRRSAAVTNRHLSCAMVRLGEDAALNQDVTIVADFVIARQEEFEPRWSWTQATAAAERWHFAALYRKRNICHHM